jgi:ParB-like chromosome segregation protein Spo0J
MEIEYIKVKELHGYEFNTRTHSDEQVAQLAASITEFGFTNPLLIDGERQIIAGHGRWAAATKIGMEDVPCIVLDHLTEAQRRAYVIADNKLALNAGWDEDLLKLELSALDQSGFDLSVIGFDSDELSDLKIVDEDLDYSGKNKEIDVDDFDDEMIIKLKFNEQEYWEVKEKLDNLADTPEKAIIQLLENKIENE